MDRWLVVVGVLLAVAVAGLGAWRSAHATAEPVPPAGPVVPAGAVRRGPDSPYTAAPGPATVADVLRGYGNAPPRIAVPEGSQELDWGLLTAYEYQPGLENLPEAIRDLQGKTVTMRGFLMPLYEFDDIHEFVLVPNHMSCCFGLPIGINGQVQVNIDGGRGLPNTNEPLEVTGAFRAVETKEQGYTLSIYRIDAAKARIVGY